MHPFIIKDNNLLYLTGFLLAGFLSFALCPLFRMIALHYKIMDHPNTSVKTHQQATPYLGGCAIAVAFIISLAVTRILSIHPTGTMRAMWGIVYGGFLIFLLGLVDDIVSGGLSFKEKFVIQFIASSVLTFYNIQINFIHPRWLAFVLTIVWVTGLTNAVNIIDIMDGLAGCIVVIAALAFLFINPPTELIYVNLTSVVLAGACLGFLPFNFSKTKKMFMGDTGSLFIGYVLASLSLGTNYTALHNAGVFAPILILGVPLYDTLFVMLIRYRKGLSPFLGSKDHFALRLERMGFSRKQIVAVAIGTSLILSICAWFTTRIWFWWAVTLYAIIFSLAYWISLWLAKVQVEYPPTLHGHKSN